MTTRVMDRRYLSAQSMPIAALGAVAVLAGVVAFAALGGGQRGDGDAAVVPPAGSPSPSLPTETPEPTATPATVATPTATNAPAVMPASTNEGSDAMPLKVDLANATGAAAYVDIADTTGLLEAARSGTPGDGQSMEPYKLAVENLDATTLKLTWVDYPIDNALALYIDETERGVRFLLVQPGPTGPTDSIGFDRELILSFSQPISATTLNRSSRRAWTRPADLRVPRTDSPLGAGCALSSALSGAALRQPGR